MARRKHAAHTPVPNPDRFFEKELAGEEPPSFATMAELYAVSGRVFEMGPWEMMADTNLVVVPGSGGQIGYCSVLGALGEMFGVQVFIGPEGYRLITGMINAEFDNPAAILGTQNNVSVEFVRRKELTIPDRELLAALGHPLGRGTASPQFRATRPGYHPWYVTEPEARLLLECLWGVTAVADHLKKNGAPLWDEDGVYPLVELLDGNAEQARPYRIRLTRPAEPPETLPEMPVLDAARISRILSKGPPMKGAVELDHFYTGARIGEPNERKSSLRMALAVDSESAIVYPPRIEAPSANTGAMLVDVLLRAIEATGAVPVTVHVRNREYKTLLGPLAKELGTRLKVSQDLRALDFAKMNVLEAIGG